jgi:hypothetical protein
MKLTRLASAAVMTVLAGLGSAQLTLSLDKPLLEAGQVGTLTIQGPAGHGLLFVGGFTPGPTLLPGIGNLGIGLSPQTVVIPQPNLPPSGVLQLGGAFTCDSVLRKGPFFIQMLSLDPQTGSISAISNPVVLSLVSGNCGDCSTQSVHEPHYAQFIGGPAFWLPPLGTDFVFEAGGTFIEHSDGKAKVTGLVARKSMPNQKFAVDLWFDQRVDPLQAGFPPPMSPHLELQPSAYAENGGPIHTGAWHYYKSWGGTLTGMGSFAGGKLQLTPAMMLAFQVGVGANGKNTKMGGSGWFDVTVLSQPQHGVFPTFSMGDGNFDFGGDCDDCADKSLQQPGYGASIGGPAFWLPGLGTDFVFSPLGSFVEHADGTARVTGTIESQSNPLNKFAVDILFDQRMNPGDANYPPPMSPKKEMVPSAYIENGGPIDPSTWHYYQNFNGNLIGLDAMLGANVQLTPFMMAAQVGIGANGKNSGYGMSFWLQGNVIAQPASGATIQFTAHLDGNFDLTNCP